MKHLLLTVLAFGLGMTAAEPSSQGYGRIAGPIEVEDWYLARSGQTIMVDATLVNVANWWIGDLAADCWASQRSKNIDADVIRLDADMIGPGERVRLWCEVELFATSEAWDIEIVPRGRVIDPPTARPTSTDVPTVEPTVTTRPTLVAPTATTIVSQPTDEPIRALMPYAERGPQ